MPNGSGKLGTPFQPNDERNLMKTRAAVAWEAGKPLEVMEIDLEGPKEGEVLIRNEATGVCHTDAFTLSGEDPEGIFPSVLGHEGGAVVEEIGPGVSSVSVGDQVIPLTLRNAENVNSVLPAKQISVRRSVLPRVKVSCLMGLHVFLPAGNRCSIIWVPLRFRNTRCFLRLQWLRSAQKPLWKKSACWDAELRPESVQF